MVILGQGDGTQVPSECQRPRLVDDGVKSKDNQVAFVYSELTMKQMHMILFAFVYHLNTAYVKLVPNFEVVILNDNFQVVTKL
jgi:hypothetical protein